MSFVTKSVKLETYSDKAFRLLEDVVYEGNSGKHVIPAGFITDFASVPPMVQWLIPSYGKYALAAIVHDWYCVQLFKQYDLEKRRKAGLPTSEEDFCTIPSRDVDGMFRRMMRELDVPFLRRWVMWTGVRFGALFNAARRDGISKDLPLVLFWSVLSAPIVAPATLIAGIALGIDMAVQWCVGRFIK